jgi:hypothetical protein
VKLGQGRIFENTVAVGGAELKGGANVWREVFDVYVYIAKLTQYLAVINESFYRGYEWREIIPG